MKIIFDLDVRKSVGVYLSNDFVFLNIKFFLSYVIGWDCVDRLCCEVKFDKNINVIGMWYYIVMEYVLFDVL